MLKRVLWESLREALRQRGMEIANSDELNNFRRIRPPLFLYDELPQDLKELVSPLLPHSKAQLAQDLFALAIAETSEPRFFVEFGATDGVSLNNTWLLEKKLGWTGILAEPAKVWHHSLKGNRGCHIETKCVAAQSDLLVQFLEVDNQCAGSATLSSIEECANNGDRHSACRMNNSTRYEVETISLNDLLDKYDAPEDIQFLSIDTEGSELDILKGYDFGRRKIRSICVEHNYVKQNRQSIFGLLSDNGYKRVYERLSKFDDWYVLED